MFKTPLLIEQHFHGCYGVNFNTATVDEICALAVDIKKEGIGFIFPTLVTDSVENIKRAIDNIKKASFKQTSDMACICGIHLEGIFLNPAKKGIHNDKYFLIPSLENYKLIEDDFIKIVTIAPEFVTDELFDYLKNKGVKIQAGHCVGDDLSKCSGVTHTFNAMEGVTHKKSSTATSALINDSLYTEIIADGIHVKDDALKLLLKCKPISKIILVSDCLPCTHSNLSEFEFSTEKIYFDGEKATSKQGVLAGSTKLLPDIIKIMIHKNLFLPEFVYNSYKYHGINPVGELVWE